MKQSLFEKRQQARKARLKLHQKKSALLMRKVGGYRSNAWAIHTYAIERKIRRLGRLAIKAANRSFVDKLINPV